MSDLDAIRRKRSERQAAERKLAETQEALDLEAIDALEVEHGDGNVAVLRVAYTEGVSVLAAVRCPTSAEVKMYHSQLNKKKADKDAAAQQLARLCQIYPPAGEEREKQHEARPALALMLGVAASNLSAAQELEEGNG